MKKNDEGKKEKMRKRREKGMDKGKNYEWKLGKLMKTWEKNRFSSYFFPKNLQISIFFPHDDIIMGEKYENLLKYPPDPKMNIFIKIGVAKFDDQ